MKLQLVTSESFVGESYWLRLVHSNGRIFMHSETYGTKSAAHKAAQSFLIKSHQIFKIEEVKQ